jgi:hypothetical protein
MKRTYSTLIRIVAAAAFALFAGTGIVTTSAMQAGSTNAFAAQPAQAAVSIGVAIGVGGPRYYRYGWQGGTWVRLGYYNAPGPGYYPNVGYVGYAPPPYPYYHYVGPHYYNPYWRHPGYRPHYRYAGPGYYGHPGWRHY